MVGDKELKLIIGILDMNLVPTIELKRGNFECKVSLVDIEVWKSKVSINSVNKLIVSQAGSKCRLTGLYGMDKNFKRVVEYDIKK